MAMRAEINTKALRMAAFNAGLSGRELAKRANVAVLTVSRYMNGKVQASPSVLKKIADALEVEPETLLA